MTRVCVLSLKNTAVMLTERWNQGNLHSTWQHVENPLNPGIRDKGEPQGHLFYQKVNTTVVHREIMQSFYTRCHSILKPTWVWALHYWVTVVSLPQSGFSDDETKIKHMRLWTQPGRVRSHHHQQQDGPITEDNERKYGAKLELKWLQLASVRSNIFVTIC